MAVEVVHAGVGSEAPTRPRSLHRHAAVAKVVAFGGALWLLALALSRLHHDVGQAIVPWPWWSVVPIAAGFGLAEVLVFHIEYRRQAATHTMTEVPMAFALVFLGLGPALVARVLGTVVILLLVWRSAWYKTWFNLGLCAVEVSLGFFLLHSMIGDHHVVGLRLLLALLVLLPVLTLVDFVLVLAVIAVFEGGFRPRVNELGKVLWLYGVSGIVATVTLAVAIDWPVVAALAVVPIVGIWNVFRRQGRTNQRLRDLEELHELTASVGSSLRRDRVAAVAVDEVRRLLRCERVALVLFGPGGEAAVAASAGRPFPDLPSGHDDARWHQLAPTSSAGLHRQRDFERVGVDVGSAPGNLIVAPITDEGRRVGLLVVGDRSGTTDRFDDGDAVRAGAIADRLGLALRNAELHGLLEHEAWHDSLTGLANRTLFERELDAALDDGDPTGRIVVLMMGVDQFREVNATLGHQAGDRVLMELTRRMLAAIGTDGMLARLAGDEFAALVRVEAGDDGEGIARQLLLEAQQPLSIDDFEVVVTLSVGSALCTSAAMSAATMLRRADIAMHWAKTHHTSLEPYRDEIDRRTPERLSMLTDLRAALEHHDIEAYFQPKLDLVRNVVVGAEALVRWPHVVRGFVPPPDFVPLAETTGLVTVLTNQILHKGVATVRLLDDLGFRLHVSVNLSTLDLVDEQIVERVGSCLADNRVAPEQLTLEITETALLADGPRTLATLEGLRELGVHLSIDDFGTGFSSLSYLRMLPASELKVDRSFVTNMLIDDRDEVIVRSTIDLGHNLGMHIAAEGVEDEPTLQRLRDLGCELAQGYGIAPPMPFDRFLVWLNSGRYAVARTQEATAALTA